jgi:hypothetical protein
MRSLLVFFLWILTVIVGFVVITPLWIVFVTFPRTWWHAYRNTSILLQPEWDMPWFCLAWLSDTVKRLDKKNKLDKPKNDGRTWVAGSG